MLGKTCPYECVVLFGKFLQYPQQNAKDKTLPWTLKSLKTS